jgi:hypothetical protein
MFSFRFVMDLWSLSVLMFPAIAPSPLHDSYAAVQQIAAQPHRVGLAIRAWAAEYFSIPAKYRLVQLAPLREIVAVVDRFVWKSGPGRAASRYCRKPDDRVSCTNQLIEGTACGHSERVGRFSTRLAKEMGWNSTRLVTIHMAGLLHDIGKVGVDVQILHKPEDLTEQEYRLIKTHPEFGYAMLSGIEPLQEVLPAVLHHHEHWDGGGYPHGLAGQEIPEIARIVAVADAYDAMTSDRPYRNGMAFAQVRRVLNRGAGIYWDPVVVEAFNRTRRDLQRLSLAARWN